MTGFCATGKERSLWNTFARVFRRVKNRIVNRPSAVQKRGASNRARSSIRLEGRADSGPNRPVLMISGINDAWDGHFSTRWRFCAGWILRSAWAILVIDMQNVEKPLSGGRAAGQGQRLRILLQAAQVGIGVEEGYRARELYIVNRLDCPYDFTRARRKGVPRGDEDRRLGLRRESREVFRPDQGDLRPLFSCPATRPRRLWTRAFAS